jgi:hypothetical protein
MPGTFKSPIAFPHRAKTSATLVIDAVSYQRGALFFSGGAIGKKSPFLLVLFFWRSKRKVRQHEQIIEFLYNYFKNADMPPSGLPGCRKYNTKICICPHRGYPKAKWN